MSRIHELESYQRITRLNADEYRLLESIRFRDNDASIKAGSILAFAGLIIATAMVELSVSAGSVLYILPGSLLFILNFAGLLVLFAAAIVALLSLLKSGKYAGSSEADILCFEHLVRQRAAFVYVASFLSLAGTLLVLTGLFLSLSGLFFTTPTGS